MATTPLARPLSRTQRFRPYYAPSEVLELIQLQAYMRVPVGEGSWERKQMSLVRIQQMRQVAIGFIERVGMRLGFPRRTIATAQSCWHRFHLHHPLKDFAYQDVSLAALLVASKLHDTLKKLREIQIAGSQVNQIVQGGNGLGEGDPQALEAHRPRLIAIERLLLQSLSFNFNLHRSLDPTLTENLPQTDLFTAIVRLCLSLGTGKRFAKLVFVLGVDLGRTTVGLSWPASVCAEGLVWLAKVLWEGQGEEVVLEEGWAIGQVEDHTEIAQALILIFLYLLPSPNLIATLQSTTGIRTSANSPSFSPSSFPSPIENTRIGLVGSAGMGMGGLSEKDKALRLMGLPMTLALGLSARNERVAVAAGGGGGGRSALFEKRVKTMNAFEVVPLTEEQWQKVQIRLRGRFVEAQRSRVQSRARGREWRGVKEGEREVEEYKLERGRKDLEREERERGRKEGLVSAVGGVNVPSEEEEREREKLSRPGSILYQF
ncbi:BZ3500_MvSof-1268-A1-R1_Chr12-3g04069 [Microbotryum saponariae]|uniref:BZ3500_MvSof-1268-A1-R1_Chr12-3g04069 protein n=1 Tax=Microbotryum saponariae TaxID=289078 RepID=A0A2X0MKE2_9BASI|nr:BZ3500_MvSof-1268-A1-R1_Chr12-3g04069 [Microbotryum saponariae]